MKSRRSEHPSIQSVLGDKCKWRSGRIHRVWWETPAGQVEDKCGITQTREKWRQKQSEHPQCSLSIHSVALETCQATWKTSGSKWEQVSKCEIMRISAPKRMVQSVCEITQTKAFRAFRVHGGRQVETSRGDKPESMKKENPRRSGRQLGDKCKIIQ